MYKCERCGEKHSLRSDLIGNKGCVSCYGVEIKDRNSCDQCGKTLATGARVLSTSHYGTLCVECEREYQKAKANA